MKLTATIELSVQARSLADAGATLDELLASARAHGDVEITSVSLQTPGAGPPVTIPHVTRQPTAKPVVPHPLPGSG